MDDVSQVFDFVVPAGVMKHPIRVSSKPAAAQVLMDGGKLPAYIKATLRNQKDRGALTPHLQYRNPTRAVPDSPFARASRSGLRRFDQRDLSITCIFRVKDSLTIFSIKSEHG